MNSKIAPLEYFLLNYGNIRDVDKNMIENFEKGLFPIFEKRRKGCTLVWKTLEELQR